jgi:ribosomal protein L7/L12
MYEEGEILKLRQRVSKLEKNVEFLFRKLNLRYEPDADEIPVEVHELLLQGKKIDAIKAYREATGASLKSAKEFVESLGYK